MFGDDISGRSVLPTLQNALYCQTTRVGIADTNSESNKRFECSCLRKLFIPCVVSLKIARSHKNLIVNGGS